MRALIVDDHPLVHEVMGAVVTHALASVRTVSAYAMEELLERAQRGERFDLIVLDLGLPGCEGIEALHRARRVFPSTPTIVLSANDDPAAMRAALAAGAKAYLVKTGQTSGMVDAIRRVLGDAAPQAGAATGPNGLLTRRQLAVLQRIAQGMHNRQIARELKVSENTVKQHLRAVFDALGVHSRAEAMVAAVKRGIRLE